MDTNLFKYTLPYELIAQFPLEKRTASRCLSVPRFPRKMHEISFSEITQLVSPGDLLVVNDTRVIPARLYAKKIGDSKVEIMLEKITGKETALVLLKSNKPIKEDQILLIKKYRATVIGRQAPFFELRFNTDTDTIFQKYGNIPLPPYIHRPQEEQDKERYQTVYSAKPGAVAAPTAGLHFDQALIDRLIQEGVLFASITLHVGAGTFLPVRVKKIENHKMHEEFIEVSDDVCRKIHAVKTAGRRVIAVGTTVVRALESAAVSGKLKPNMSYTHLFIHPYFQFRVIDALFTNFHLPQSTLLMMIIAFAGHQRVREAYEYAIEKKFRFLSYGDAMYLERDK